MITSPYLAALQATWPPARLASDSDWCLRDGAGGGKRVSAATAQRPDAPIAAAEAAMEAAGQTPLFMVRRGDEALDSALDAGGYEVVDPTVIYDAPVEVLAAVTPPLVSVFPIWEPLQIILDIWAEAGIGPGRVAVMQRAAQPKCALLGRIEDRPAAAGFCAIHEGIAMVHALEVRPALRRKGMARLMLHGAAGWAQAHGATRFALAVTRANAPANALYSSLGMQVVEQYHYRQKPSS